MLIIYDEKRKEEIMHDVKNGMNNLAECMNFVWSSDIDDKAEYLYESCSKEFLTLKQLKDDLEYAINNNIEIAIANSDYFLVKRWNSFDSECYKTHIFNKGGYHWYHG